MIQELNSPFKENILVVDNEPINLHLLNTILSSSGYKVQLALDEASALISIQSCLPDLILLDILMLEIAGYQFCKQLKSYRQTIDIPVIFILDLDVLSDRAKVFTAGGVDYIAKPFEKPEIIARIENQLNIRRLSKQLTQENCNKESAIEQCKQAEIALKENTIKLQNHNQSLMELALNSDLNQGNLKAALREITKITANNLIVERVSIWVFDNSDTQLKCLELFSLSLNKYCEEAALLVSEYPIYFQALAKNQAIVTNNVHIDPRTQEYSKFYYQPRNIMSVLDTPIRLKGKTIGVVSCEQIDVFRSWTAEDQNFTRSVADLITLALEAQERKFSENRYRELFEGSVDGIVITEIDGRYIDCNASFYKMLGYSLEELQQLRFQDLTPIKWHEAEAEIVRQQLQGEPSIFEKEYFRKDGSLLPIELTAFCRKNEDEPTQLWAIVRDISAQKQAKATLIESEQKYRHLVEASQDMIWSLDANGCFSFVNAAVKQIYGYEPEEMIGRPFSDFLPPYRIEQDLEILGRLINGESIFQYESIHLAKDGKPIQLMFTAIAIFDLERKLLKVTGTASNITERKRAEAERDQLIVSLQKSKATLAAAQKVAHIGSWEFDLLTKKITWSEETFRIYNFDPTQAEPSYTELLKQIYPDDLTMFEQTMADMVANGTSYKVECRIIEPKAESSESGIDFRYIEGRGEAVFNKHGQVIQLFGTVRDITDYKLTEIALIDSEQKYRYFVETSQDLIWSINNQGCFTFINPVFKQIYGYEPQEMLGRPFTDFESPERSPQDLITLQQILQGKPLFQYELTQLAKNGKEIHLLVNATILLDKQGNVIGATGTATNITERVQIEAALRESQARFSLAVEGVRDGIWDWNLRTNEVYLSPRWKSILGYEDYELPNTIETWQQCIHPEDVNHTYAVLGNYLDGASLIYSVEFRARCKDGSYCWILARGTALRDELGKPYRMCGSHTDISDRKQAEAEILYRKELFESVFNESADAILLVDGETALTVDCNRRAVELFEASHKNELLNIAGTTLQKKPFTAAEIVLIVDELVFKGIWNRELEYVTKKGNLFWGNIAARFIHIAGQEMHLIRITDITERKQQEDALRLIVEGTASVTGKTFMHTCVRYLAEVLQVRYASISESIDSAHTKVRILAFWQGNTWIENKDYIVAETPRQAVLNSQKICYYKQFLPSLFPNALDLVELNAESYIGVPLIDDEGIVLGLLSVLDVKPMAFNSGKISILKIFASRAAAELKRQKVEQILRQKAKQEKAIAQIIQQMRSSLDIETIFRATTEQLRLAINCERVVIYRFNPDWSGNFVAESVATGWISLLQKQQENLNLSEAAMNDASCFVNLDNTQDSVKDTYLQETKGGIYNQGINIRVVQDIYKAGFQECYINLLEQFQARAYITIPIISSNKTWGLLATYQTSSPRQWEATEINIVIQVGIQLGVALQQAELLAQTQQQSIQLAQAKDAAEVASQAKSQFLASMSHELRTPLNAILGFTQVMNRDASASPQQQEYLGIILRSGKHLLELINDILEMTKIEAGRTTLNKTSFDLHNLLDSLLEMLQLGATSKGLQLSFETVNNLPQYIQADQGKLRQVLINLLDNAIKFTETGRVNLRVSFTINNSSKHDLDEEQINLYFEIEDTGLGIASEEIELLFEAFAQTETGRKSMSGTGLGLPISRSFVQQMGGDITVESIPKKSTTFRFNIQCNLAKSVEIQTLQLTGQVIKLAPNQEYRILVTDDDLVSRQLLVNLLTVVGFQVREAANGEEAVTLWQNWQPHLIWMDIQMPVLNGYEAIQAIRKAENLKHLASLNQTDKIIMSTIIIALTSNAFEEQRTAILKTGCNDFICKPFSENLLFEKMAHHLGVRYLYNTESIPQLSTLPTTLTKEDLNIMPSEWVQQLYQAALAMDDQLVIELLNELPQTQTHLSKLLMNLVDNFRLDVIIDCIDEA